MTRSSNSSFITRSHRKSNGTQKWILTCMNCQMRWHNIEFCWIIYPELRNTRRLNGSVNGDIKGKQIYNAAKDPSDASSVQNSSSNNSYFTKERYERIIKMLDKSGTSDSSSASGVRMNMGGIIITSSNSYFNKWIIDTWATNHMTFRSNWFQNCVKYLCQKYIAKWTRHSCYSYRWSQTMWWCAAGKCFVHTRFSLQSVICI